MSLRKRLRTLFVVTALVHFSWIGFPEPSHAAQPAQVIQEDAQVFERPGKDAPVIDQIKKNTSVAVSNLPTEGFYKVRSPSGKIGWISAQSIEIKGDVAQANTGAVSSPTTPPAPEKKPESSGRKVASSGGARTFQIRAWGGANWYRSAALIRNLTLNDYTYVFGGQLRHFLSPNWSIFLRPEWISTPINANDQASGHVFSLAIQSFPVLAGVGYHLKPESDFSLGVSVGVGLGIGTQIKSTDATDPAGTATLTAMPLVVLPSVDGTWNISSTFSLFAEVGYRLMKTPAMTASSGSGAVALNTAPVLDLSGLIVAAGAALNF